MPGDLWTAIWVLLLVSPIAFYAIHRVLSFRQLKQWQARADSFAPKRRQEGNYLVVVNTKSGRGRGELWYKELLVPLFNKHGVSFTTFMPSYSGHTKEWIRDADLSDCSVIVLISGDGLIHETLNGMWLKAQDEGEFGKLLNRISLVMIPAGTMNGMATELGLRSDDPVHAIEQAIEGTPQPVDIWKCTQSNGNVYWDCTYLSWAVIAEIDHWQERVLRNYGWLIRHMLPPIIILLMAKFQAITSDKKGYSDASKLSNSSRKNGLKSLKENFFLVLLANISNGGPERDISPNLKAREGAFDIVIGRASSRISMLFTLLQIDNGTHVGANNYEIYKSNKLIITPHGNNKLSLSGEEISSGHLPMTVEVHPTLTVNFLYPYYK